MLPGSPRLSSYDMFWCKPRPSCQDATPVDSRLQAGKEYYNRQVRANEQSDGPKFFGPAVYQFGFDGHGQFLRRRFETVNASILPLGG